MCVSERLWITSRCLSLIDAGAIYFTTYARWVRSHDFDESKAIVPSLPGKPVLRVPSSENPAEEPKAEPTSSTLSEEAKSAPTSLLDEACEVVDGDDPYEDSQLHGPFPPGQTSPPPVSSTQDYPGLSRPNDGDANSHVDEVHENLVVNASNGRERVGKEGEGLGDLDARASAVLERCRQLLATSSTTPAQVTAFISYNVIFELLGHLTPITVLCSTYLIQSELDLFPPTPTVEYVFYSIFVLSTRSADWA